MPRDRLLLVVLVGEALVGLVGLVWIRWRDLPVRFGSISTGLTIGLLFALLLALANLYLLLNAPGLGPVQSIRQLYRETLRPLFSGLRMFDIFLISAAAGAGEEILFRGAIQTEWGLIPASILFGSAHIGGRHMLAFSAWAGIIGLVLGTLTVITGGLLAPIVAHAVYDAAALAYLRMATDKTAP